jgi:hypothetical protein
MAERSTEPGTEEGWLVIDAAARSARDRLGDGLLSAYAIGSLAHGGFRTAVSDVDLALLTDDRTDRDTRAIVAAIAVEMSDASHALAHRLSIFHAPWAAFSDPPPDARFPPIDRYDLVHHGVLIAGSDLRSTFATAPSAGQIRAQAVDCALRRVTPDQLDGELRDLTDGGVTVHNATKTVLWPVRLQHVCDTGEPRGNAAAVEHYLQLPDGRHRSLVRDALAWRDQVTVPDPGTVRERITDEILDLHAEVFERLSLKPDIPRHDKLGHRVAQLTSS